MIIYQYLESYLIMAGEPVGEYLALIEHKRHKIIKFIDQHSTMKTQKIYTFLATDAPRIQLYRHHFENVKDWHKLRFYGKSILNTLGEYELSEIRPPEPDKNIYFKVTRKYIQFVNLEQYYNRVAQNKVRSIPKELRAYVYMFQEFLSVMWRGGGINHFFYTPKNIFIVYNYDKVSGKEKHILLEPKLEVNFLASVGLELLFFKEQGTILKEDLIEIYPLLPPNLFELMKKEHKDYKRQINRLIRLRAFGWLVLTYIMGGVKNLLVQEPLQVIVDSKNLKILLQRSQKIFSILLGLFKTQIKQVQTITSIKIFSILKNIFQQNCKNLTWNLILKHFFLKNNRTKQSSQNKPGPSQHDDIQKQLQGKGQEEQKQQDHDQETEDDDRTYNRVMSKVIIKDLWHCQAEQQRQFYRLRSVDPFSSLYLLIKLNINFHHILKHSNLMEFVLHENFSEDSTFTSSSIISELSIKSHKNTQHNQFLQQSYNHPMKFTSKTQIRSPFKFTENGVMYLPKEHVPHLIYLKSHTYMTKKPYTPGKEYQVYIPHRNNEILFEMSYNFL